MDEATIRGEIFDLGSRLGYWPYHPPDDTPVATEAQFKEVIKVFHLEKFYNDAMAALKKIFAPPTWRREKVATGRPDLFFMNPRGWSSVIEVKAIEPMKRDEPYFNPKMISDKQRRWLDAWTCQSDGIGLIAIGTKDQPRRLWIWPWEEYIKIEKAMEGQKILIHIFPAEYECTWVTGEGWRLPEFHPLLAHCTQSSSPKLVDWNLTYSLRFEEAHGNTGDTGS
jgi:hypothetical protein